MQGKVSKVSKVTNESIIKLKLTLKLELLHYKPQLFGSQKREESTDYLQKPPNTVVY